MEEEATGATGASVEDAAGAEEAAAAAEAPGIEPGPVTAWLAEHLPELREPLSFELITGGRSNLTFKVTDSAGHRWALRRPPLGKRLGSAHDMGREYRAVSALAGTEVPVSPLVGICEDEGVTGAPFYVMEFVEGPVLRGPDEAALFPDESDRHEIGVRVAETLAALHSVDPDAVGLGELGRKEGYVPRQLKRWHGQWEQSKTRELPLVDEVHARLAERIPEQGPARIVHGDYRLDNLILAPPQPDGGAGRAAPEIAAVVDWELCTLGDPLADLGLLMVYWAEPEDRMVPLFEPATRAPGFPGRAEIASIYAELTGRDISGLDYYTALGYWKLAIILEGVVARYSAGQHGETDDSFRIFVQVIEHLVAAADQALDI